MGTTTIRIDRAALAKHSDLSRPDAVVEVIEAALREDGIAASEPDPEKRKLRAPRKARALPESLPRAARQAVHTIALEDAINAGVRDFEPMIAFQIPDDPDGPEVIVAAQMQDLLLDCLRRPVRMVVRNRSLVGQPRLAVVCKGMTPSIEAGSPDPEVSAGLADVTRRRSVIQNAQLAPGFLLVFGH